MLYRYSDLIKKEPFNSNKKVNDSIEKGLIFKLDCGFYSDKKDYTELEYISKKYNNAIFNSDSAFFYQGLTDNIPTKYFLSTKKKSRKIINDKVKQTFMEDKYFEIGLTEIYYNNIKIKVYDKERLLIELVRNKNNMSYDMYKEIISNYRQIIHDLDLIKLQTYLKNFKNNSKYLKMIQEEVL